MNRSTIAAMMRQSILAAWQEFLRDHSAERPYAFALIGGQECNLDCFAIATEERLKRTARAYDKKGYRYQGWEWEEFDNCDKLSVWLRWSNPDDGWFYGQFADEQLMNKALSHVFHVCETGVHIAFEEFCTDALKSLQKEKEWQRWSGHIVLGFSYGENPRDFLRTATRANPYLFVSQLWGEYWRSEEVSHRIPAPRAK